MYMGNGDVEGQNGFGIGDGVGVGGEDEVNMYYGFVLVRIVR